MQTTAAADEIRAKIRKLVHLARGGWTSPAMKDEEAQQVYDAVRAAALNEAIEAARTEYLHDDTRTSEDRAYNQGVSDAVAAIGALLETAAATSADANPITES
ncbi:hypothetical protein QMK19_03410 [Streptomyces sp. H10-C2]|uniref:hypothetical protein n=1 Tax=unclassified Streptomyces TaxID=2593676 RepID=UPI0024B8ED8B|nr:MULTISPECIES: hypothetical protein [unclassified Streptomyces]MDJ0342234.1 hypothetical protein [Streptomyces sp. PH10-H1]MDJ0368748.1 hypothetical protein [Streptomyces sp. H10-C2]